MRKYTPGPWFATTRQGSWDWLVASETDPNTEICQMFHDGTEENELGEANSRLVAAAPKMLDALMNVRKLISEAAMTGFNCKDGDWAERLFANQADLTAAIDRATRIGTAAV